VRDLVLGRQVVPVPVGLADHAQRLQLVQAARGGAHGAVQRCGELGVGDTAATAFLATLVSDLEQGDEIPLGQAARIEGGAVPPHFRGDPDGHERSFQAGQREGTAIAVPWWGWVV
jgi:hypothetical protein